MPPPTKLTSRQYNCALALPIFCSNAIAFPQRFIRNKSPRGPPRCLEFTLILLAESLDVRFPVRIEEFLAALLPRRLEFGRCDVPVWPAFLGNGTKVLAEIFHSGPAEVPVAVVDLIDDETRLEDNHMRDHRIVDPYTPRCRDLFGRYAS